MAKTKITTEAKTMFVAKYPVVRGPSRTIILDSNVSKLLLGLAWSREYGARWSMWINYVCIADDWKESIPHPMDLIIEDDLPGALMKVAPKDCSVQVCVSGSSSARLFEHMMAFILGFWNEAYAHGFDILSPVSRVRQAYRNTAELFGYVFED